MKPLLAALALVVGASELSAADPLELQDGDRVVFVGNTLIEREQRYGYWEAALTRRFPDKNVTFRNLGWSGDTVWGDARAIFDSSAQGFQRLIDLTLSLKPTVIVVAYGTNESFAGEAGVPKFVQGYNKLLDALAPAKARIVLMQPLRLEQKPAPLPDVAVANRNIARYSEAIAELAKKRDLPVIDLNGSYDVRTPRTDAGMHLTAFGYWDTAHMLAGLPNLPLELAADRGPWKLRVLPLPPFAGAPGLVLARRAGLKPGTYSLTLGGKVLAKADAKQWAEGVAINGGPDFDRAEKLRETIVEKNELFFHKWRPQNITYLLGFRKNEQGNNAVELAQFDPLIAAKEAEIAKLRKPVEHEYELIKE